MVLTDNTLTAWTNVTGGPSDDNLFPSREDTMTRLTQIVQSLVRQDEGQDLLEYSLLVALIALVTVAAVTAAGVSVDGIFTNIAGQI